MDGEWGELAPREPFCITKHEILQIYQITAYSTFILSMYNYSITLHLSHSLSRCVSLLRTAENAFSKMQ